MKSILGVFLFLPAFSISAAVFSFLQCEPLDLTHTLNAYSPLFPLKHYTDNPFISEPIVQQQVQASRDYDPVFIYYGRFSMAEHIGTHIDSPQHVVLTEDIAKRNDPIDKVPLHKLVGEACVIDIPSHARDDMDYVLTVEDLMEWESKYGRIGESCFVVIRTGRGRYWHNEQLYFGAHHPQDVRHLGPLGFPDRLHWPGLSYEGAKWLVESRDFVGIATDAASFDPGNLLDFAHSVHSVVLGSNRVGIENLANVDQLPVRGATIIALPLKMEDASGSPARVIAYGWDNEDRCWQDYGGSGMMKSSFAILTFTFIFACFVTNF